MPRADRQTDTDPAAPFGAVAIAVSRSTGPSPRRFHAGRQPRRIAVAPGPHGLGGEEVGCGRVT